MNLGANFIHGCDPEGDNVVFNAFLDMGANLISAKYESDGCVQRTPLIAQMGGHGWYFTVTLNDSESQGRL